MKNKTSPQSDQREVSTAREPYEAPAIIYEGLITTRAGSPILNEPDTDPANIFNNNG